MRKIFANLKSVVAFAVVAAMTLSVSCMYDDTALTKRVDKVEKDLAALTEKVNGLNGQEVTLDSLLAGKLVITGVTTDEATGNKVITLSDGSTITVLAECEGLQYRNENGVLELSADGETWVAVAAPAEAVVKAVVVNEDGSVTITLADDTQVTVGTAELIECEATRSAVYAVSGITKAVRFTINDAVEDINVMNQPFGWSATVEEYVEVEEPDYGGGAMPLAVGGKEYVLNINAPSYELVKAGYAAKEGVISVHFNTAAGACKVMKVEVTLAELTLAVEGANIILTNSVAFEQTSYWGEKFTDFADFWIGFMPKAAYEAFLEGDEEALYEAVYSQRTSGFQTAVNGVQQYEEGVCEKESYTFTLDEFYQGAFYGDALPYGVEYVVFVTTEHTKTYDPDLSKAVTVDYQKSLVEARIVEGTETWNDVTLQVSLAGYENYSFLWISDTEVQDYLSRGYFGSTIEEFLPIYYGSNYTFAYGGSWLTDLEPTIGAYVELSQIAALTAGYEIPRIASGTLYHLAVYPFNGTEDDLYTHEFDASKLLYCGTFETAPLVAGTFDAGAEFVLNEMTAKYIDVNVTFSNTDIVTVAYQWKESSYLDPEEAVADLLADEYYTEYVNFDEETTSVNAVKNSYYNLAETMYLAMVVINANGEYVYVEQWFGKDPYAFDYDLVLTSCVASGNTYVFKNDEYTFTLDLVDALAAGTFVQSGYEDLYWKGNSTTLENATWDYPAYIYQGTLNVALDGDNLTLDFVPVGVYVNGVKKNIRLSFSGTVGAPAGVDLTGYTEIPNIVVGGGGYTIKFSNTGYEYEISLYGFSYDDLSLTPGEYTNSTFPQLEYISYGGANLTDIKANIYANEDGSYTITAEGSHVAAGVVKTYFVVSK